jgi:Zn-dependent protease with chaperone function
VTVRLSPTRFHRRLRDTLAAQEPGLFRWYSSDAYEAERVDRMRLELLRSSYRMSPDRHERPHRLARDAAAALEIDAPIALYQLHGTAQANAGLCFAPGEIHIVLSGPLVAALDDAELAALFGHELAHHRLLTLDDGAYRVACDLIEASAAHDSTGAAFVAAALRNRRWTEVFADRGAAIAGGGIAPAIACLVKLATGLAEVSTADYLAQAREVVARLAEAEPTERDDATHPETAVRAVALELWQARGDDAEPEIAQLVEGAVALETLDVVQQRDVADATRRLLDRVLAPAWMRSEAALAHARRFFPDYAWSAPGELAAPGSLADYLGYVLLDFAVADPSLGELALAQVLAVAAELALRDPVAALARKELKLTASAIAELEQRAPSLFARAAEDRAP